MNAATEQAPKIASPPSARRLADALRVLAIDAVQKASSGHPGMPMGMADVAEALWNGPLRHNPGNPGWADRDRFVLSNGHGSMLLYALLHLTGYPLPIEELKRFRQLHSATPGHPEYGRTPGVETTTGPLGQGFANAVGMAIAERILAAAFNRPGHEIVDHRTYVFVGDGCLMEGISHEAASLAGTLRLSKLVCLYDDNGISIDGRVSRWFADDTAGRFRAYGWHVVAGVDGHDREQLRAALESARAADRPTLICCRTVIGQGSPNKAGSHDVHGAPLGENEVRATRERLGWDYPPFEIPAEIREAWDARARGAALETVWNQRFEEYARAHPALAAELRRRLAGELPEGFGAHVERALARACAKAESIPTRKASQNAIEAIATVLPELVGGSADLTWSNLTQWPGAVALGPSGDAGNYLHYGVREFAMAAIMNGMALHGGVIPFGGTFLAFSDYARNALRMAALMRLRSIFVLTHDSIGLGEDGPTHQPVEHAASLRLIPGMEVWRPCDAVETLVAWRSAVERRDGPTCLLLSRQSLPFQQRDEKTLWLVSRGGYVLSAAPGGAPRVILLATGSEVAMAMAAQEALAARGIPARVVSMPCTSRFDRQDEAYRQSVLVPGIPRVAIEAGVGDIWRKYVGLEGAVIGIDRFGESAPAADLFRAFGVTTGRVVEAAQAVIAA